ncbi:J domain-containing protein [Variovorax paradoxus]|uniref:J domain-containing protein n=1 Tax=Variovorax paradoxus TaxID=34073 RepID=UPI0019312E1C|nr:J domain-containing protein [Variovorax paradoxus]
MNYYDVLGVRPSASDQEIELAYRSRRTQYHPDKYAGADAETMKWATAKMQEVNAAYAVLSDAGQRRAFNESARGATQEKASQARERSAQTGKNTHTGQADSRGEPHANKRVALSLREMLQQRLAPYRGFSRTYFAPAIPAKKLAAARGNYAMDIKEEDVLVMMDATVFGGAKEGLILTNEGIRIKELMVSPIDWQWKDVRALEVRGTALRINGHQMADNTMVDKPEMQRLFAVVQEFLRQLSGPVSGSRDAHAPQFSQSETPWNDPAQCQVLYVAAKEHLLELSKLLEPVEQEVGEEWLDRQALAELFELSREAFSDPRKARLAYRWVLAVGRLCEAAVASLNRGGTPLDPEVQRGDWDEPVVISDLRSMLERLLAVIQVEREEERADRFFER